MHLVCDFPVKTDYSRIFWYKCYSWNFLRKSQLGKNLSFSCPRCKLILLIVSIPLFEFLCHFDQRKDSMPMYRCLNFFLHFDERKDSMPMDCFWCNFAFMKSCLVFFLVNLTCLLLGLVIQTFFHNYFFDTSFCHIVHSWCAWFLCPNLRYWYWLAPCSLEVLLFMQIRSWMCILSLLAMF